MKTLFLLLALLISVSTGAVHAQDTLALGLAEAREHCARCHPALVSGRADRSEARRMRALAQAADPRAALASLLERGHAGLDAETFSQAELGSLAAYLASRKW